MKAVNLLVSLGIVTTVSLTVLTTIAEAKPTPTAKPVAKVAPKGAGWRSFIPGAPGPYPARFPATSDEPAIVFQNNVGRMLTLEASSGGERPTRTRVDLFSNGKSSEPLMASYRPT
jgi:hypothetical protein